MKRRGAIYAIRFRVPVDLIAKLGLKEFHRSLGTHDPQLARRRAASVTIWFRNQMDLLRRMPTPTLRDLDDAAAAFFRKLLSDADQPRDFDDEHFDEEVALNVEHSQARLEALDDQLRANSFDPKVEGSAALIAKKAGGSLALLDATSRLYALKLAARAEREQMRFMIHALTTPSERFEPASEFTSRASLPAKAPTPETRRTLKWCVAQFVDRRKLDRIGTSHLDEMTRALDWLSEHLGPDTYMDLITPDAVRAFRDGVEKLDVTFRASPGRSLIVRPRTRSDKSSHKPRAGIGQRSWPSSAGALARGTLRPIQHRG